jgi:hypothetical protein
MCTLVFYFANRNHLKFKFELNSNEFVNYKVFQILERVFSPYSLGLNLYLFSKPAQPASFPILLGSPTQHPDPLPPGVRNQSRGSFPDSYSPWRPTPKSYWTQTKSVVGDRRSLESLRCTS